jgi:hypothetical protein
VHTVDKVDRDHAALPDRALVLLRHVARRRRQGVAVANRGLYVEEAEALRPLLPPGAALWFVVGFDKIVQVLDRRYYGEPEAALARLFALAGFLVAPRAGTTAADLRALLARPQNRTYAARVHHLPLPPAYRRDSATEVRALLAAGRDPGRLVPAAAREFVAATGCYRRSPGATPSDYAARRHALSAVG